MVFERIASIVVEHFRVERSSVTRDTRFEPHLCADALDRIELALEIEQALGVRLTDDEIYEPATIGELVAIVEPKLREAA